MLIYPGYPETFWSFKSTLKIIGKKAAFPPLGLLTVAAMLPKKWKKKVVDMNVEKLKDEDIEWADMVMISAMIIQKKSVEEVVRRVRKYGKRIIAGGPLFTTGVKEIEGIDNFVLGETEDMLTVFLRDLEKNKLKKKYIVNKFPDITKTVVPEWNLINLKKYNSMSVQYSRGCPFNCEFCDIVRLNGRVPRVKTKEQVLRELEVLYKKGWRDGVFFVDDNFIGNKERLKNEILPAVIEWQKKRNYPFLFNTQASVNLADDEQLMSLMVKAGFVSVFIGVETPDEKSLNECGKFQNNNRDLLGSIKKMQNTGLEVQAGFIVGFDSDTKTIFKRQIEFIQKSGIVSAMVGLLTVLPATRLYKRLKESGRLIKETLGNNTLLELNFIPKMNKKILLNGYKRILTTVYSPKEYYKRVLTFLKELKVPFVKKPKFHFYYIRALAGSMWHLGIWSKGRFYYWKLLGWSLFKKPEFLDRVITYSLMWIHFKKLSLAVRETNLQ